MRKFNKLFILISIILLSFACMGCKSDENLGDFYSLSKAYSLGWLSRENLVEISNRKTISVDSMDKEISKKIRKKYYNDIKNKYENKTVNDIYFITYFGVYNECHVVQIGISGYGYTGPTYDGTVGGVEFTFTSIDILVWRQNEISIDEYVKLYYLYKYIEQDTATIKEVYIEKNLGVYNDAYVLLMSDKYTEYSDTINKETIGDYVFEYSNCNLLVYYKTKFYNIKEAYRSGILKKENIEEIYKQFPKPSGDGIEVNGEVVKVF